MDKSTITTAVRSTVIRRPTPAERSLGLWVDRIGAGVKSEGNRTNTRLLSLYAVVYIEDGEGTFYSPATGEISVTSGDNMILFPEEPHIYISRGQWRTKWVVWDGPAGKRLEEMGFISTRSPVISNRHSLINAYYSINETYVMEGLSPLLMRKAAVLNLVAELAQSGRTPPDSIDRVIAYILHTPEKNGSVPQLARMAGLSESHFRRTFLKRTGKTPKAFINFHKMAKARQYLARGKSIKETAAALGFFDFFYFMRLFKQETGLAPGRFREL